MDERKDPSASLGMTRGTADTLIWSATQLAALAMIGKDGLWITAAAVLIALIRCLKDL